MIQDLHHIGVAVKSLDEALPRWVDGFGLRLDVVEEVPTERVKVAILFAGRTRIELLEPTADDSPIAKFLTKRGEGVHHLAFKVDDTGAVIRVLTEHGAPMLDDAPRPGAHGTKCAFVHPKWLGGVLAEIVQDPEEAAR
ncbi:MAG: methylmalonyl-CoA epimerase [Planctomycetes bacterium]|nr:methylmalonyl-CoA epimerase [Planctomycetota bacterium]